MAEIIAEPTALSKVIALKFKINDVDVPKTTQLSTNKQFNTTDTDAWFTFELDGLASINGTYDLTLINLDDKSIFHHDNVLFQALPFHYKLNSSEDVTLNEIRHAGRWLGQLVVTLSNGDTTGRQFGFNIAGHILDGQDAQVILLSDYQALINTINLAKDDLAQYNVDYSALLVDIAAAEDARVVSYNQLLADVAEQLSATNQPIVDTGNYFSADNTNAALQELGAHKASSENPHGVTKAQVGLGNVDNTSDANKPVSTAVQTALNLKANNVQEAWITPTLLNGWVNFDSGYASCQYRIDSLGTVHLKGMIKNGTLGAPCFTLALGYRPIESQHHLSLSSDAARTLTITSSGDVRISSVASKSWVSFNGITFKI